MSLTWGWPGLPQELTSAVSPPPSLPLSTAFPPSFSPTNTSSSTSPPDASIGPSLDWRREETLMPPSMQSSWSLWWHWWQCWPAGSGRKQGLCGERGWRRRRGGGGKPTAPAGDQSSLDSPLTSPQWELNLIMQRWSGSTGPAEISLNIGARRRAEGGVSSCLATTSLQQLLQCLLVDLWAGGGLMGRWRLASVRSWQRPRIHFPSRSLRIGLQYKLWGGGRRRKRNGN